MVPTAKRNSPLYNRNRQRQIYMKANGYKVPQDGSWGPWQQSIWNKLTTRQKEYETTLSGLASGLWDRITGNNTYKIDPLSQGEIKASKSVNPFKSLLTNSNTKRPSYLKVNAPYTYKDDLDPYRVTQGPLSTGNDHLSRLGELGLVKGNNGKYKLYDDKGKQIIQCAKTRNEIEKLLGHPTTNNAWDTFGFYGDSTLYNGYPAKKGPYTKTGFILANQVAAERMQKNVDNIDLQTGDVISLYNPFSHYSKLAWNTGTLNRSNTHTGVIYQPYPGVRSKTYVIHNVNGNISVDPIGNFFITSDNKFPKWRATGIFRPGTKDHPYLKNGQPAHL